MAAKYFTEPLIFQEQTLTSDGIGGKTAIGLSNVYTCLANIVEKATSKTEEGGQLAFKNSYEISIWFDPAFTPSEKSQINWNGKNLVILSVVQSNDKRYWLITAESK